LASVIPPWATVLFAVWWGAIWGSFANVLVWRWPRGESLVRPGSHCPRCGHAIRWYDNIPVLSWFVLGARCRDCDASISGRYPLVEATSALLGGVVWYRLAGDALAAQGVVDPATIGRFLIEFQVLWGLMAISLVDLETLLVPDVVVLPLVALALVGQATFPEGHLLRNSIAALAGYAVVALLFSVGWKALTGHEGMGLGDGKILALLGAHLGPFAIPFALVAGAVQGLVYVLVVMVFLRGNPTPAGSGEEPADGWRQVKVPFGPFLALSAIEAVFLAPLIAPLVVDIPVLRVLFIGW
jgi:leader peptidase (prepilin peptidase) / N-methyltransferase